jgi:hypothetical protein
MASELVGMPAATDFPTYLQDFMDSLAHVGDLIEQGFEYAPAWLEAGGDFPAGPLYGAMVKGGMEISRLCDELLELLGEESAR